MLCLHTSRESGSWGPGLAIGRARCLSSPERHRTSRRRPCCLCRTSCRLPSAGARGASSGWHLRWVSRPRLVPARIRRHFAAVFSSSSGDGQNCHESVRSARVSDRRVSPTRFHNSVHNAAAGYWSIATGAKARVNGALRVRCKLRRRLARGTDASHRRSDYRVAAWPTMPRILSRCTRNDRWQTPSASLWCLLRDERVVARAAHRCIHRFARRSHRRTRSSKRCASSIPAARSLPLLRQLARREPGRVTIDYLDVQQLAVEVAPCG